MGLSGSTTGGFLSESATGSATVGPGSARGAGATGVSGSIEGIGAWVLARRNSHATNPATTAVEMALDGRITDGLSVAALLKAEALLRRGLL